MLPISRETGSSRRLSWSSFPLRRLSPGESTPPRLATPSTFRPQGFSPSRRISPRPDARPCFRPVTPLGFRSSGAFPRCQAPRLVAARLPSWRFLLGGAVTRIITTSEALKVTRSLLPSAVDRLQGLSPAADPYPRWSVTSQPSTDPLLSFTVPSRVLPRPRLHPASCVRSCASSPIPSPFLGTSPRADEYLEDCAPANPPGHAVLRFLNRNNPL